MSDSLLPLFPFSADFRNLSHAEKQLKVKNIPKAYNPLLYRWISIEPEDFERLFVDMRLHAVCVSLMEVDPRKRPDYYQLCSHPSFR